MYKFLINSSELSSALAVVSKVILSKNSMPILDNILLRHTGDDFTITGASTENELTRKLHSIQIGEGDFQPVCLNAAQLSSILASLPEQTLNITIGDHNEAVFQYDNGQFEMPWANPEEYPQKQGITLESFAVGFSIDTATFLGMLAGAATCVTPNELRPVMSAVWVDVKQDGVVVVGSDGHKLYKESYLPGVPFLSGGKPMPVLVPQALVRTIAAAFAKTDKIDIEASNNLIHISSDDTSLLMSAIEGAIPNYDAAIPTDNDKHFTVSAKTLAAVLKRVLLFASASSELVRITTLGNNQVKLSSEDLDFACKSDEVVQCSELEAPDNFCIGVKGSNVIQQLSCVASENVRVEFSDPSRAIIIREDDPNSSLVLLVMPLLLND